MRADIPRENPVSSPVLSRPEAARYVNVGLRTFDQLVKDGSIICVKPSARRIGFLVEDLQAFLRSRRVTGKNDGVT